LRKDGKIWCKVAKRSEFRKFLCIPPFLRRENIFWRRLYEPVLSGRLASVVDGDKFLGKIFLDGLSPKF
jgi:hypothetical protein